MSVTACLCLIWEDRQGRFHGRRSVQQKRARGSSCRRDSNKLRNRKNRAALFSHLEKQVLADPRSFSSRSFCHPILPGLHLQTLFLTGQCPPGCPGDCSPASVSLEVRFSPAPWKSGSISKLECKGPSPWVGRGAGGGRSMGSPAPSPCSLTFFFFLSSMFSLLLFLLLHGLSSRPTSSQGVTRSSDPTQAPAEPDHWPP